jgi:hypothetical protein
MKKALVILLILAVAGGLFAQDVKVGGQIKTGILFDAPNGTKGQEVGLHNDGDDEYVTRIDLNFSLTKEDYGVVVGLRNDWLTGPSGMIAVEPVSGTEVSGYSSSFSLYNAYAWADFARDLVNVKIGIIDDGVWKTEGDEGFGVATGNGLRVEVKPVPGLNAGVFLTVPDAGDGYYTQSGDGGGNVVSGYPYVHSFKYFLPETAIGASYEADLFNAAFGVKFDSNADGFAYDNPVDGTGPTSKLNLEGNTITGVNPINREKSATGGQRAYIGFSVKAIENLKIVFEGQFYNLGAFNSVGYAWFDEIIEYSAGKITGGLVATQFAYSKPIATAVGLGGETAGAVYLKFKPYGEFAVNDAVAVGVGIPVAFWKNVIKYDISVEPYVTYKLADTASIGVTYKFNVAEADKDNANADFNQKVQVNFNYSW